MTHPKVTFYQIKNNSMKIQLICQKCSDAYKYEKRLLITAPNLQAANYLDTLLWKLPENLFLPHVVTDLPTAEWIAITLQIEANINQASQLLNLWNDIPQKLQNTEEIFEIFDETHPDKRAVSEKKLAFYQSNGMKVNIKTL